MKRVTHLFWILIVALVAIPILQFAAGLRLNVNAQTTAEDSTTPSAISSQMGESQVAMSTLPQETVWTRPEVGKRRSRNAVRIDGQEVIYVTGDRNSPVIYGLTNEDRLYRSSDDGLTWRLVTTRPQIVRFVMSPADPDILYSGAGCAENELPSGPLFKSMDGGANWSELSGSDGFRPLLAHPTDPDTLYVAGCSGLYLTTDGGATWVPKLDGSASSQSQGAGISLLAGATHAGAVGLNAPHWGYLYAGGDAVAFSGDEGGSWSQLTPSISPRPTELSTLAADPYSAGRLWFADDRGVWSTEDFGATWSISMSGLDAVVGNIASHAGHGLNALVYHPRETIYLGTNSGLYGQEPGASNWNFVPIPGVGTCAITDIVLTESNPQVLWLNTTGGTYRYWLR